MWCPRVLGFGDFHLICIIQKTLWVRALVPWYHCVFSNISVHTNVLCLCLFLKLIYENRFVIYFFIFVNKCAFSFLINFLSLCRLVLRNNLLLLIIELFPSVDYGHDIARNSFCRHKHDIFHRSLMFLSFYICLHYSFHKHTCLQHKFYELGNYSLEIVFKTAWQLVSSGVGSLW